MYSRNMALARRVQTAVFFVLIAAFACGSGRAEVEPDEVVFQSGKLLLHGFLWKPSGTGPFPAVIWNHGSERNPGSQPALARFYTDHLYAFFAPHRRGQGRSPGLYIQDLILQVPPFARAQRMVELQDEEVADVIAAVSFLKLRPFVDPSRIVISGCSYGGIQTLLAGERDLGVKALVPFAPGAMSWARNPLLAGRLRRAVRQLKAPAFLIQAQNDYSLEPVHVLSGEAKKAGKDFRAKLYPAFGRTDHDGHWGFCTTATAVWGEDVLAFLADQK